MTASGRPPAAPNRSWNSTIKRSPWGEKARKREQHEAIQAKTLEGTSGRLGLFQLHHVDFLHCVTPRTDKGSLRSGFPDYMIICQHIVTGVVTVCFLEIKHGKLIGVKGIGRLSTTQRDFHARLRDADQDVMTAWLPEDLRAVNEWLESKTGRHVNVDGLIEAPGDLPPPASKESV